MTMMMGMFGDPTHCHSEPKRPALRECLHPCCAKKYAGPDQYCSDVCKDNARANEKEYAAFAVDLKKKSKANRKQAYKERMAKQREQVIDREEFLKTGEPN
jgi:hypothetical protein